VRPLEALRGDQLRVPPLLRPSTSNRALVELFSSLGLEVDFDQAASPALEQVLEQVSDWYLEPARAEPARVFVLAYPPGSTEEAVFGSARWQGCKQALSRWVGMPLPTLDEAELVLWVADAVYILAEHSADPASAPQLLRFETTRGELFLWRSLSQRRFVEPLGWLPETLNGPDTAAALKGDFRVDGCSAAFATHAPECPRCLNSLIKWDAQAGLPEGWEHLRRWPTPVPAPPLRLSSPPPGPLTPAWGVAIHIPRPGPFPVPRPPSPWWRFWT
jgi:hypothetical protein